MYTLVITNSKGEEIHRKVVPAKQIDEANFTKVHIVKALLNVMSKS